MKDIDLARAHWRTSSYSSGNGQCVEVAHLAGIVALRDSKNPQGPMLAFRPAEFNAFTQGVAHGEFVGR